MTTFFGGFALRGRLAVGGTAEVYLAEAPDKRAVALKVLLPFLAGDPDFVSGFLNEARMCMELVHPNIARALAVFESSGQYGIAIELVEGPTLAQLCRAGRLPAPIAMAVLDAVLKGLGFAHARDIVHRDVTPHNVLVGLDGRVRVTDFGAAKALFYKHKTRTGVLKGQFSYMSPEQAQGRPVDVRSDVFSVGLLAYELLTGTRAYATVDDMEALRQAQDAAVPPLPPDLPPAIARALQKDPAERFPSAAAFAEALSAFPRATSTELSSFARSHYQAPQLEPVDPEVFGQPPEPPPPKRRSYTAPLAMLAVAVVLSIVIAALLQRPAPMVAPPPAAPASAPIVVAADVKAPDPAPPSPVVRTGFVTLNSRPWATVAIDGRTAKRTPMVKHPLPAGRHKIVLTRPDGSTKAFDVHVVAGETVTRIWE